MNYIEFEIKKEKFLGDLTTPVSVYLNLRDKFLRTILLESSDYNSKENASSFIAVNPIAEINVKESVIKERVFLEESTVQIENKNVLKRLHQFFNKFRLKNKDYIQKANAIFGYIAFDAVPYFEIINFRKKENYDIPEIWFSLYQYIIEFKHFSNEISLVELIHQDCKNTGMDIKKYLYSNQNVNSFFQKTGNEVPNMSDDDFLEIIDKCKRHCLRGDVFKVVPSRQFKQAFKGDDFLLYSMLRSINPSPYQFYFDYGNFHLMGASPETQIKVQKDKAYIFPIAGTFKRTGNETEDLALAEKLKKDPKEMAEHTMLVDLARNDLSRNGQNIRIEKFSEIQFFSHVIHLVSKVSAGINRNDESFFNIVSDTFPAGTLSGAPKYRAIELIDEIEPTARSFYGGAVGTISFNKEINLAIIIRSLLSKDSFLYYQAGAGIVEKSIAENELSEVNNKLAAVRKAIDLAEKVKKYL